MNLSWEDKQLCNASKLTDNKSTESGQCSHSYSTPSISFAHRSRGKSPHWANGSINPTLTHPHHIIISLHHLRHSTPFIIINHHHHHITSNHPHHPNHNSAPQIPRVHSPAIYNLHHGLPTTEPHPHPNIIETPTLVNLSCTMKLP
jgi:hypothetical protein